jgi:hypothetical protein
VTYWYVRSVPGRGLGKRRHIYVLDEADLDMTYQARFPPPAWELPDGAGERP